MKLTIWNYKGIVSKTVDFQVPHFIVGPNGSGKTSLLSALRFALTGKCVGSPLRTGAESGEVVLYLAGHTIQRIFKPGKTSVSVDGAITTASSANDLICDLLDVQFDDLCVFSSHESFLNLVNGEFGKYLAGLIPEKLTLPKLQKLVKLSDKEMEELASVFPASFGIDSCAEAYTMLYQMRTAIKKERTNASSKVSTERKKPDMSEEEISRSLEELSSMDTALAVYEVAIRERKKLIEAANKQYHEIDALKEQLLLCEDVPIVSSDEIERIKKEIVASRLESDDANKVIATARANIQIFKKTLDNLKSPVCPLSEHIVCMTDRTSAKEEIETILSQNTALENDMIAKRDNAAKHTAKLEYILQQYYDQNVKAHKRKQLQDRLTAATASLIEIPPEPVKPLSYKPERRTELINAQKEWTLYQQYLSDCEVAKQLSERYDVIHGLVQKLAPNGLITNTVIGYYADIFNESAEECAADLGYHIQFTTTNGFHVLVCPAGSSEYRDFMVLSRGEQMITCLALLKMCNDLTGSGILLIDNFNDLDRLNHNLAKEYLNKIASDFKILVVAGTF